MPTPNHVRSLTRKQADFTSADGSIARLEEKDFPLLRRLSIRRLLLAAQGLREPHWHANSHELGYCIRGRHLVTIAGDHSSRNVFTIDAGQMFFVPAGYLHSIENVGDAESEIILGFSNETVEDFGLSGTFGAFTDAVLANTTGVPVAAFAGLARSPSDTHLGHVASSTPVEEQARHINPYKYDVEGAKPPIDSPAGSAHTAQTSTWPILKQIAMFSLRLTDQGMREVHWHPDTAEMGYVASGTGRMTILDPGGSLETYEMNVGDVYFIPRAYPHHIENISGKDLHLLIFFDQGQPGDIGGKSSVSAFPRHVLAATFHVEPSAVPAFPFTAQDPLIVPRINPVDRG